MALSCTARAQPASSEPQPTGSREEGHQSTARAMNTLPCPLRGAKAPHSPVRGSMSCATGAALGYPGLELLLSPVCAGAWHVLLSPVSSLQQGWAPVLAHWSNWFAGRKQRSCSRQDQGHITVPSPPAWAALPSRCCKRLNWEYWEPEGQGRPGHRCAQLWQGARVAVSSDCHFPAARKGQRPTQPQAAPQGTGKD